MPSSEGRLLGSILLLALFGAGCQPLPHPFAGEPGAPNPLLQVPESYGLVVEDVAGLPQGQAQSVRQGLAEALQREQVLASAGVGNIRAYRLSGVADPASGGAAVDWRLLSPAGEDVRRFEDVGLGASASPLFAREVADALRASLPADQQAAPEAAAQAGPAIALAAVEGAPGDGSTALSRALAAALAMRGIRVVSDSDDRLSVAGTVAVEPVRPGVERVDLVWSVLAPDRQVVGTVRQSNEVAAGSLDGRWGAVAEAAAQGAADGIVGVLDGMRAKAVGSG